MTAHLVSRADTVTSCRQFQVHLLLEQAVERLVPDVGQNLALDRDDVLLRGTGELIEPPPAQVVLVELFGPRAVEHPYLVLST